VRRALPRDARAGRLGYAALVDDTSAKARRRYEELLRATSPAARLAIAVSLSEAARELAMAGIRSAYPGISDREATARLAERMYGAETARRLFPEFDDHGR
jgi:hypothetical protein